MQSSRLKIIKHRPMVSFVRGFGLLQVLLLIAVMAGLAAMGYLQWRERTFIDSSRQERQALAQADRAVQAFATLMSRLPCPDTNRDGVEDCATLTEQKGWLPTASLRLAGVDPGVDVGQLRYLVQRGSGGNNLTALSDSWRPLEYDGGAQTFFAMRGGGYPTDILTLTDLCQRLETARTTPVNASLARVDSATIRSVAYALAHPGINDADGDGDLFDGANSAAAANANLMADPARRPLLAAYNDIVLERSFASLQQTFQCQPLIDSINTVALGHDVVTQVAEMRADNIEAARRAVAFMALAAIMNGLDIALAVAEGISDAGNAAADWVICAASLGLAVNACAAAPQHTVAIGLAGGVVYANIAAVALNAIAAGIAGTALTLADGAATPSDVCPPKDPTLSNQMLANATAELINATNARAAVQTEITNKTAERNAAIVARTAAITSLRNVLKGSGVRSDIDGLVDPLLNAAGSWGNYSYSLSSANTRVTQATNERNLWAAEVAKYDAMLADRPGTITRLTNEIAALDALIATNPPNKAQLQDQRAAKDAELKLAQDPTGIVSVRDKAVASLNAAQNSLNTAIADRDAAQSGYNASMSGYQVAYANLNNGAARFAIYNSSDVVIAHLCTTACQVGDVSIATALFFALYDLFGDPASFGYSYPMANSPSPEGKYLKPVKLQKELDALSTKLTAAQKRETDAQTQLDQIQQLVNNPAGCNTTGSAVVPMTPAQAEAILIDVDRKGGVR